MTYKILLPVTVPAFLVEQKLKELPLDKTIIVNNFDNKEVYNLTLQAKDKGAEVWHCPVNLGLKATWNLGLRRMMEDNNDFLVILSPSAVFDKSIGHFIQEIEYQEDFIQRCRYIATTNAHLHCFAHTKRCVELGGYFDENFYPLFYGDCDWMQRAKFNGVLKESIYCGLDNVVHSAGISLSVKADERLMACHMLNAQRRNDYYIKKWGGDHCSEKYKTPFNDPYCPINHWVLEDNFVNPLLGDYKGKPDFYKYLIKL